MESKSGGSSSPPWVDKLASVLAGIVVVALILGVVAIVGVVVWGAIIFVIWLLQLPT